jgi:hypothetical protein
MNSSGNNVKMTMRVSLLVLIDIVQYYLMLSFAFLLTNQSLVHKHDTELREELEPCCPGSPLKRTVHVRILSNEVVSTSGQGKAWMKLPLAKSQTTSELAS